MLVHSCSCSEVAHAFSHAPQLLLHLGLARWITPNSANSTAKPMIESPRVMRPSRAEKTGKTHERQR
jgi:hypothetical protein